MIKKNNNQHLINNSEEAQLILKALNTNWKIKIDFSMHEQVLKYIHGDIFYCSPRNVWPKMKHLIQYFANGLFADFDDINSPNQPKSIKQLFCMTYISTLYTKWLINDFGQTLLKKKDGVTYNLNDERKNGTFDRRGIVNLWRKQIYVMEMMTRLIPGHCPEHILGLKYSSSTPFLSRVFNHLIQIKHSFSLFLEIFYRIMSQMDLSIFDFKTYNSLNDSVVEEKYDLFRDIVYGWNNDIIPELTIILEHLYPIFLFLETNIQNKDQNILDNIRCFLTEHISQKYSLNNSPIIIEASLTSYILITIINYLLFNILKKYLNPGVSECLNYFWPKNKLTGFHLDYIVWINENMNKQLYYFQNTTRINLLGDLIDTDSQTIINNEIEEDNENNNITQEKSNHGPKQQQELGSGDETVVPLEKKLKRHLSVGHGVDTIKKLAKYLVNGFTNKRGSLPALVSSTDGNAINQLIFLFTGNRDYSFDGPYNLTWNAEQVYLKLLIKLVHNLNELATGSHAVDEGRADYISNKYIKCRLKGGVWPKVAEAFENIKSEASIRNADYKKNYKDTKALINKKRLNDMKLIADLWLKCKYDIDF